jgi:HTH-type transcriptional regulator/antitoxin HigA
MDIRPIKTESDYRQALAEVETLMMSEPDSPGGEKLDVLTTLLEAYERTHYPMDFPDPVEIWRLHEQLGIPAESLIKPGHGGQV